MNLDSPVLSDKQPSGLRMVRPIGVYALHGIAFLGNRLFAVDRAEGLLLEIDRETDNTTVLNPNQTAKFAGATGLAIWEDTLWFARDEDICCCPGAIRDGGIAELKPEHFVSLSYPADGIAVWKSTLYVTCQRLGYILVFDVKTGREIT
ncbi:MAG: transglutaminase, partial [Microcoleus sp.]